MTATVHTVAGFRPRWHARVLPGPPLIAPARSYVFPRAVPGEEDALARGALWLEVSPATGGKFLSQCALGFAGDGVASGVWPLPNPDEMLAVAGGYAYRIDTRIPEQAMLLPMQPVVAVHSAPEAGAVALTGFHAALVLTADASWQSGRLSWEGITEVQIENGALRGMGWHMPSDTEHPFRLDLRTRELTGGGFDR